MTTAATISKSKYDSENTDSILDAIVKATAADQYKDVDCQAAQKDENLENLIRQILKEQFKVSFKYSDGTRLIGDVGPMTIKEKKDELLSTFVHVFAAYQQGFKKFYARMEGELAPGTIEDKVAGPANHKNLWANYVQAFQRMDQDYAEDLYHEIVSCCFLSKWHGAKNMARESKERLRSLETVSSRPTTTIEPQNGTAAELRVTLKILGQVAREVLEIASVQTKRFARTAGTWLRRVKVSLDRYRQQLKENILQPKRQEKPVQSIPANPIPREKQNDRLKRLLGRSEFALGLSAEMDNRFHLAVAHYQDAAQEGDIAAQMTLGEMYQQGRGVPQSIDSAVHWLKKAAVQGIYWEAKAAKMMGRAYGTQAA